MQFDKLVKQILEAKEAPKGKHYNSAGQLRKGDADSDGRGGPKYRSDPTYNNPNDPDDEEIPAEDREFFFGYDLENVYPVQEFVKANYKEGEYEMSIGYGDEVMNHLKVNVDLDDERGRKLLYMIEDCDGEGNYDEDDYEEDAEGKIDKDRMKCNSPRRTSGGSKKFVVKACKDGKEKIVRFGDPNMKIKKSNPKRRKSFRARHKCDQKKDKFSAGYWSCKKW